MENNIERVVKNSIKKWNSYKKGKVTKIEIKKQVIIQIVTTLSRVLVAN